MGAGNPFGFSGILYFSTEKEMVMPDNLKLLTKDYFNRHPIKDISAARFEYSMLLHPEVMDIADEVIPELQAKGLSFPEDSAAVAAVEQEDDTARLLRMLRKTLSPKANRLLLEKVLAREEEMLPEIQRMILKAFSDSTIENCTRYLVRCRTNCSEWIIQNYNSIREPYARSMLCLVLGFRASLDAIPFLMQQVEVFETRFPSETFDQGPVLALSELKARFRTA